MSEATRKRLVAIAVGVGLAAICVLPWMATPSGLHLAVCALAALAAAAGWYWRPRASNPGVWSVWAAATIAAALLVLSVPLVRDGGERIMVRATGQKSPQALNSEVWVRLHTPSGIVDATRDAAGWEHRGDIYVSYQNQPAELDFGVNRADGAFLEFVSHDHSGIAEVVIGKKTKRIELYSPAGTSRIVPLPEADSSWRAVAQRIALALAMALMFAALLGALLRSAPSWGVLAAVSLVAASSVAVTLAPRSYPGSATLVAFGGLSTPTTVELDAGHGFSPSLHFPMNSGAISRTSVPPSDASGAMIRVEDGVLGLLNPAIRQGSESPDDCLERVSAGCVYEVSGTPSHVWLEREGRRTQIALPKPAQGAERLFLVVQRHGESVVFAASRAYVELSPWSRFSQWVQSVRIGDGRNGYADTVIRVDGTVYVTLPVVGADGSHAMRAIPRHDTPSFVGMKLLSALIAASFIVLMAALAWITRVFVHAWRSGVRLPIALMAFGWIVWLGVAVTAGWPAIMGWDGLSPYIQAQTGQVTLWYGLGYPLIVGGFLLLGPPWLITVWSLLGVTVLMLGSAALATRSGSRKAAWLAALMLCALIPLSSVFVGALTHLRDAMNGLMLALFTFSSFVLALRWRHFSDAQRTCAVALLVVVGCCLALLRVDNLPALAVLLAGFSLCVGGLRLRSAALVAAVLLCWLAVNPLIERKLMPDRDAAAAEKRTYGSTALINPLTGFLVHGRGRIPEPLYEENRRALAQVLDVEHARKNWSAYNVVYWHQTNKGPVSEALGKNLRKLYVRTMVADPLLFLHLRMATFGAMLGHDWFGFDGQQRDEAGHPSFNDHLLTDDPNWKQLVQLYGYSAREGGHVAPRWTVAFLEWSERTSSNLLPLVLCVAALLMFRRAPLSAVVALSELARAGVFFLFAPASVYLYLYDLHLIGFVLPLLAWAEVEHRRVTPPDESGSLLTQLRS